MSGNKLEEIKNDIENSKELEPYSINIDMIENHSGKVMNLIKDVDEFSYQLNNKYYNFKFTEEVYIQSISFTAEGNTTLKGLELTSIDYRDNSSTITFSHKEHNCWLPRKVMKEFKIKPPTRLFKDKIKLTQINIVGFQLKDLDSIKSKVDEVSKYKESLNTLLDEIETKNQNLENSLIEKNEIIAEKKIEIDKLNQNILDIEKEIDKISATKEVLEKDTTQLKVQKESLTTENTNLENNVQQLEEKSNKLNTNISNQTDELKKLTENTNIFATEMKEYIEQGNKDIKLYTKLSLIPWILIAIVSAIVFYGASDLTTVYTSSIVNGKEIDIGSIFWSRIPFVLIVISILFVSYEISKIFITNIIYIHKQKRTFTKIGILAKDIAEESILGLDIDEKEKFELRTKLKMDLLKSHLKNDIGENYEYKVKTSLLEYLKGFKKTEKKDNES